MPQHNIPQWVDSQDGGEVPTHCYVEVAQPETITLYDGNIKPWGVLQTGTKSLAVARNLAKELAAELARRGCRAYRRKKSWTFRLSQHT